MSTPRGATERAVTIDGTEWTVSILGRFTAYERDEFPLLFERRDAHGRKERRVARFSPQGARVRALALAELRDADLVILFRQSQAADTSPELGYARG